VLSLLTGGVDGILCRGGAQGGGGAPASDLPPCLWILSCAILARKDGVRLTFRNHCQMSINPRLHLVMSGYPNTLGLLFSNLGVSIHEKLSRFLHCGMRKPTMYYFAHNQNKMHVGLFKLYSNALSCPSNSHVENLQEISCCFYSEIRLLLQPNNTLYAPLRVFKPYAYIAGDIYHTIHRPNSKNWQHPAVQFPGLCRQML
jgi:hypothetical protein